MKKMAPPIVSSAATLLKLRKTKKKPSGARAHQVAHES